MTSFRFQFVLLPYIWHNEKYNNVTKRSRQLRRWWDLFTVLFQDLSVGTTISNLKNNKAYTTTAL